MIRIRTLFALPALGLLALTAACGGEQAPAPAGDAAAPAAPAAEAPAAAPATAGAVHELKMVTTQGGASGVFEPANLTVKKGDIIRLTSDGVAPHNLSFASPENAGKTGLPGATSYLAAGQTVDVPVTMDAGSYVFQCDPHAAMGMKGTLTVQ
jgi:plastocyanin